MYNVNLQPIGMGNSWNYDKQGPCIYPKYILPNHPWGQIALSHAKRTADRKPRSIQSSSHPNYRYKKTPTWIQALVAANDGFHPRCSRLDCDDLSEHGAHMKLIEWEDADFFGEITELINAETGQKESERQYDSRACLIVPLCQQCHQSGLEGQPTRDELTDDEYSENLYYPEIIIIDSMSDSDLVPDSSHLICPGCVNDEVLYPRWHLSDEMIFPIDSCRGCGRIIFSSSKYSPKESDEKCDCDFTGEDDYGFCIDCGLPIQY